MKNTTMSTATERTKIAGLTIDGSDSRDLDDAFWLESVGDSTLLHISITDVGDKIAPDSDLDKKAQQSCTTHYLAHSNRPMLPHAYSEGSLSLLEGVERNTLTFSIPIDAHGDIGQPTIQKTCLQSKAKLNYKSAEKIMLSAQHPLHPVLNKAHDVAQMLFEKRRQNGALTLYDLKNGYATSEDGLLQTITADESYNSHIVIQEFMILVNQVTARFFAENEIPGLYRNHTSKAVAPERNILLKDIDNVMTIGSAERLETLANKFTLIFNKANYAPIIEGHYALNLPAYMHITSPIRRYADLINMRQLSAFLTNDILPYSNETLQTIGAHINSVLLHHQQETRRFFKKQMHKKNAALLSNNNDFSTIEGNDFYLLLKTAAHQPKLPTNLQEKITHYLTQNKIDIRILLVILFKTVDSEQWKTLKSKVLERLSSHLHEATTLLSIATQTLQWQGIQYEREMIGNQPPHSFATTAHVVLKNEEFISDSQTSLQIRNKKTSEQLANFNLLCKIVHIEIPLPLTHQPQSHENTQQPSAPISSVNHVGKLVELCQGKGWQHAEYQYGCEGPSHQPVFDVQAKISINDDTYFSETIQGGNKKSIKQLAAASLIEKISHLPAHNKEETKNFIGQLNTLSQQKDRALPVYTFSQPEEDNTGPFKCVCSVVLLEHEHDDGDHIKETFAYGSSKKRAKQVAAERMWKMLQKT